MERGDITSQETAESFVSGVGRLVRPDSGATGSLLLPHAEDGCWLRESLLEVEGLQARRDALADGTSLGSLCTSRPTTPYGGSSEIQQNSLASQVLGLPS